MRCWRSPSISFSSLDILSYKINRHEKSSDIGNTELGFLLNIEEILEIMSEAQFRQILWLLLLLSMFWPGILYNALIQISYTSFSWLWKSSILRVNYIYTKDYWKIQYWAGGFQPIICSRLPCLCCSLKVLVIHCVDWVQFTIYSSDWSNVEHKVSNSGMTDPGALGGGFT